MTREQYKNQMKTARVIARQNAKTETERRRAVDALRLMILLFGGKITAYEGAHQ